VMIMHWSGKRLASVSYDQILLIMEFNEAPDSSNSLNERELVFIKYRMEAVPKCIYEFNRFYFFTMMKGMYVYCLDNNTRLHIEGETWYPRKTEEGELELIKSKLVSL